MGEGLGDHMDDTTNSVWAENGCCSTFDDFYPFNLFWVNGNVSIEVPCQRLIGTHPINHHQHLLKGSTPDDQVALGTLRAALLHFNPRYKTKQFIQ